MMPSQKLGNDTPNSDTREPSVSQPCPAAHGRQHAERHRHDDGEEQRAAGQLQGGPSRRR
jgi:hypothetical protein